MPPRKLDELGQIVDDAKRAVEELQYNRDNVDEKLDQLHDSLEEASDTVDELEDKQKNKRKHRQA
jgi:uncharacterized coiled-coil DUF342 family protein